MSSYPLTLREVVGCDSPINTTVQSPVPGVVLIDIDVVAAHSPAPLHWRAGSGRTPPVDFKLEPSSGRLFAVQVVLQDTRVARESITSTIPITVGLPLLSVEGWPVDRYRDVVAEVVHTRGPSNEMRIQLFERTVCRRVGVPDTLLIGVDLNNAVCELVIGPLTAADWAIVAEASP